MIKQCETHTRRKRVLTSTTAHPLRLKMTMTLKSSGVMKAVDEKVCPLPTLYFSANYYDFILSRVTDQLLK
jgi:hypothetical protein